MALQTILFRTSWRDAKGWIGKVTHHISCDDADVNFFSDVHTAAAALQAAIGGLTNCAFAGDSGLFLETPPTLTYGDNLQYPAEWMKAVFTFSTDDGEISRFKIPAPEIDLMETDGITIKNDGTQLQVVAYVNAVKNASGGAFVSTRSGHPYTHFEGGIVRLGKQPRRFNGRVKSATLVAGEGE